MSKFKYYVFSDGEKFIRITTISRIAIKKTSNINKATTWSSLRTINTWLPRVQSKYPEFKVKKVSLVLVEE